MAAAFKDDLGNDNLGFQVKDKEGESWESRSLGPGHLGSLAEGAEGKLVGLEG